MSTNNYAIWWVMDDCADLIGELPTNIPDYIRDHYCDRCGRPGRGRLWREPGYPRQTKSWPENELGERLAKHYGGIVIEMKDAHHVAPLPGYLTTMAVELLQLPPITA